MALSCKKFQKKQNELDLHLAHTRGYIARVSKEAKSVRIWKLQRQFFKDYKFFIVENRALNKKFQFLALFSLTRFMAASGGQRLPFGFEEAFKGERCIQGGKRRHSRGINADKQTKHTMRFIIQIWVSERGRLKKTDVTNLY